MNYSSPNSHLHPNTFSSPSRQNNLPQLEGSLYAKQGASMTWKSQYLQATPLNLHIYEQKGGKLLFTLNLQDYQVLWHGQLQEKHTFVLKNKGERIKDIRWLYIGADSETTARNWYHFFLSIVDHQVSQINGASGPIGDVPVTDMMITDAHDTKRYSEKNRMSHISERSGNSGSQNYSPDIWKSPPKSVEKNNHSGHRGNLWHSNQGQSDTKIRGGNFDGGNNGEFALPDEAPVWVETIFSESIKNNVIWKDVGDVTIIGGKWKGLEQLGSKMSICQYKDDAQLFRAEFKFEKVSAEKVFKVMLDVENKKKWDNTLDDLKVLFYAPTTKQAVVQEIYKSDGLFERKREFVYTRYVFKSQDSYFIVQQSLNDSAITTGFSKPLTIASCRGTINSFILQVVEKNRSVFVSVLTKQTNGGLISTSQDTKLTLKRLYNIKEIEKILHNMSETAASDVTIVPSPEREKGKKPKFVVNEELIRNGFDSQEDAYWRKKEAAPSEKEKGSSYVRPIEIDIPRSRQAINLSSARMMSEEENLKDEDINEKMLTISNQKKRPGPDPLEIDLSGHSLEEVRSFTRSPIPAIEEDYVDENQPLNPVEDEASLMALLEKMKRNGHVIECIDKKVKRRGLSRKQKEAKIPDINGDFMCGTSWKRDPNGGLEFIDQEVIKRQKQVVLSLLQTMGRNILEGKSLVNMSLPIIINGKQTTLHRAAMNCAYAPVYLPIAAEKRNPLEAFKQVLTFFFTSHHVGISQEKPFNPILGETYQGFLGGVPVDCEQISHHPPISAVYMRTNKFILQSNFRLEVVLGGPNSAKGLLLGNICVKLPEIGVEVHGLYPPGVSTGTTMGKRLFYFVDKLRAYDPKHNFYAELVFNPDDKGMIGNFFSAKSVEIDKVIGSIYKLKPEAMQEFVSLKPKGDTKWPFDPKIHAVEELSKVEGKWTKFLKFDGRIYWEDHEVRPFMLIDKPNKVLPSDCQFREDLIWRKMNNFDKGQLLKEVLEEKQRADRKFRAAHSKGHNKH